MWTWPGSEGVHPSHDHPCAGILPERPRYIGARTVGSKAPGLLSGPLAPLRLVNIKDPEPPNGHDGLGDA